MSESQTFDVELADKGDGLTIAVRGGGATKVYTLAGRDQADFARFFDELATDFGTRRPESPAAVSSDAEDPPSGPWDVVQASLVLFFLPDLAGALDRYRASLSPTGRLGFTWFGEGDDSLDEVMDAIADALPDDARPPRGVATTGPFGSVDALEAVLRDHGFREVSTTGLRVTLAFDDPDHWWAWTRSQGMRVFVEQHEARGTLDEVRARVTPMLEARDRDGGLRWWTDVRVTLAHP